MLDRDIIINPKGFPIGEGYVINQILPKPKTNARVEAGAPKAHKATKKFAAKGADAIMATDFPSLRWTVPGYVAEGLSVLAGRQKLGKTWMALDFAVAVAIGGVALGSIACEAGDVLYLDLENGERRIKRRLETMFPDAMNRPDLSRLKFATESPDLGPDFLEALEDWRTSVPKPALVVVDVLQRIKPAGSTARNAYENDYAVMTGLQQWATRNGVSVLVLHHTKKGGADDPLEALSGSNGLSACADTTLVLDRSGEGITLYVRGRDVEEKETALRFDGGMWSVLGAAAEVKRSDERTAILTVLTAATEPLNPREIAIEADMKRNNVDRLLGKMARDGEIVKSGRGLYVHPTRMDLLPDPEHSTPGKIGTKVRSEESGAAQEAEIWHFEPAGPVAAASEADPTGKKCGKKQGGYGSEPTGELEVGKKGKPGESAENRSSTGTSYLRTDLTGDAVMDPGGSEGCP